MFRDTVVYFEFKVITYFLTVSDVFCKFLYDAANKEKHKSRSPTLIYFFLFDTVRI
jgi:hypothetical protein